jgi:hypothetical protein
VFGITAPQAAAIDTLSGHAYAAAVPEAASWAMLCVGLLTLAMAARPTVLGRQGQRDATRDTRSGKR